MELILSRVTFDVIGNYNGTRKKLKNKKEQKSNMFHSMHRLAVECRKGIRHGTVGLLLREEEGGDMQRLVDILLLRWAAAGQSKDKTMVLCTAIILHALAIDPANVPHLSRCLGLLRDIIFTTSPISCGDIIEKQASTLINTCSCTNASDDCIHFVHNCCYK